MNRYTLTLLLFLYFVSGPVLSQCGKVISVHDGDTFVMFTDQKQKLKVRIAYIDAPEHNQSYGLEAKTQVSKWILNQTVCIYVKYLDPYKRSVSVVILKNGKNLNEQLVKNGLAWHYKKYSQSVYLSELQADAKRAKIGLWRNPSPIPPWVWRKNHHIGYNYH